MPLLTAALLAMVNDRTSLYLEPGSGARSETAGMARAVKEHADKHLRGPRSLVASLGGQAEISAGKNHPEAPSRGPQGVGAATARHLLRFG